MAAVDTGDLSQLCRTVLEILTTIRISPSRRGSAMKVRQTRAEWPFPVRRLLRRAPRSLNHLIIFVRSFTFNVTVVVKKKLKLKYISPLACIRRSCWKFFPPSGMARATSRRREDSVYLLTEAAHWGNNFKRLERNALTLG